MTAFTLKVIALTAMFIDHIGSVFSAYAPLEFRVIGRLTFPIFVYLIAEGFRHTRSPKKYLMRLFAFAIISEPFYDWAIRRSHNLRAGLSPWHVDFLNNTNIFYTLFLGGLAIAIFQWVGKALSQRGFDDSSPEDRFTVAAISALPTLGLMWIAEFLTTDYGAYGVLFIFIMYVVKNPKWLMLSVFAVMNVLQHRGLFPFYMDRIPMALGFHLFIPATLLTVPLIAMYNGERGPSFKWLFYIAYPAHLGILAAAAWFIL